MSINPQNNINIDKRVNGRTELLGLIGNPVKHTVSPLLHNTISQLLSHNNIYIPIECQNNDLEDCVKGIRAMGFKGFNITVPHKTAVMSYLDEITSDALLIGAVNTVKSFEGRLVGYNTDGKGFVTWFENFFNSQIYGKKVFILGAGGSSRSIAVSCALKGAEKIFIANRTETNAENLAAHINESINNCAVGMGIKSDETKIFFEESDIIINTTSVGMHPNEDGCPIDDEFDFNKRQIVCDIIYSPVETVLLKKAKDAGCKSENGLGMLYWQGILAYCLWNDMEYDALPIDSLFDSFSKEVLGK